MPCMHSPSGISTEHEKDIYTGWILIDVYETTSAKKLFWLLLWQTRSARMANKSDGIVKQSKSTNKHTLEDKKSPLQ